METRPERRGAAARWTLTLAGVLAASLAASHAHGEGGVTPASFQPLTLSIFIDRRLPPDVRPSIDEAVRRLSDSRCADVLTDFRDLSGRRLDANVESLGHTAVSYLSLVLFYDGRATPPCASRSVLAWTNTGSRAVMVCWDQFQAQQRWSVGYTANTLIHETLHTLGLGETPPDPREITARVAARCGN